MKTELTISDLTPEEAHLISKFADLLEKSNIRTPERSRIVLYPDAADQVRRIIGILNEEVSRGSE